MPPLPQSIALHIGAHKTASSHLQNTLYRNRGMLADEGIRVYGPGFLRKKGRNLAAMFGMSWSESPSPHRTAHDQLAFLAKGRKRLVFTEENFVGYVVDNKGRTVLPLYPAAPERIGELVAKWAPVDTQLFVAIRNPASFLASAYSQSLFAGAQIEPRMFRAQSDWRKVDWAEYIARLRAVPAVGDLFVWRQEDYDRTQRLILRRLLPEALASKVEINSDRVNQGMSDAAVHDTLRRTHEGETGPLARAARYEFPIGQDHKPFELYAPETLAVAQSIYDAQFEQIIAMDGITVLHPPNSDPNAKAQG